MVLLCNDKHFNIKKTHILKSLEKKRENFKIAVEPLDSKIECLNITDAEITKILNKNNNK